MSAQWSQMNPTDKPIIKRIGPRRVTTEPAQGQTAEPVDSDSTDSDPTDSASTEDDNRDRLNRDKPPHY